MTEFLKTIPHLLGLLLVLLWSMVEAALVLIPVAVIPIGAIALVDYLLDKPDWSKWLFLVVVGFYAIGVVLSGIHYLERHIQERSNTPAS